MKAQHIPADDPYCGWIATLAPPPPARPLDRDLSVDCAVVGAGFTGLAAARRLAELQPGWRIGVLEAQRAGYGAAGRSSGFVVDLAGFIADMKPADAERFITLSRAGIAELRRLVTEHQIDCAWDDRGWLHVAAGDPGMRGLESLEAWLESRGERFEHLDAAAMERLCGSSFYRAAARLPGSILVQPAALVRGLAASLPETVELWEQTPVRGLEAGPRWRLEVGTGRVPVTVLADRVLLATNGMLPALGVLRSRVFPLFTFGSFTRPLTEAEQASLGDEREWGLLAQDPMGSSLRRTRDQRLLVRNSVHYTRAPKVRGRARRKAREAHRQALARRYPQLAEIELEHTWAGLMGMTANHHHYFGRLQPGLYAAGGYFGAGISMGTACGCLLAELAAGGDSTLLREMQALPCPAWVPPEPILGIGVRWRLGRLEAGAEHV
jgi:glycine/D-amino acid oxidase-like deaminating enzyme